MYLNKQTKSYIYVVIITTVVFLGAVLLFQNIYAPTYINSIGQAPTQQIVAEQEPQPIPSAASNVSDQNEAALPPPVAEQPAEQAAIPDSTTETTAPAAVNMQPIIFAIVAIILVAVVGAGIYFLLPIIKERFTKEDADDLEREDDSGELQDADESEDHIVYEEGRGYRFIPPPIKYTFEEQDEPELEDAAEPEADNEPGAMKDLELCREIERLTVKSNQLALHIRAFGNTIASDNFPEITQVEEYDELPYDADELEQEINRLKNKTNLQIDYIEKSQKKQESTPNKEDNDSEKPEFLKSVGNAFGNIQAFKPKRSQDYIYVPIAEFFNQLSQTVPDYSKNKAVEALIQHGIIDGDKYDTVYNKTRVLKVHSKQFEYLTMEIAHDVGV